VGTVPLIDRTAFQRLRSEVERVKCELSEQEEAVIHLPHFVRVNDEMVSLEIPVNRGALEMLTAPLVERAMALVGTVLERAGLAKSQVDEVLLVGGQTRMPLIWRRIESEFSQVPHKGVHPDEAVALGAALLGNALGKIDNIVLIDVLAVSIGHGTIGGGFRPVLTGGNSLPASVTFMVRTHADSQEELQLLVFQGDSDRILNNEYLGTATIGGITPAPRGKVQLKISFNLDVEGLLTVTASEHPGGKQNQVSFGMKHNEQEIRELLKIPEGELPSQRVGIPLSLRNATSFIQ
jgi:molecular chaperone DnaK